MLIDKNKNKNKVVAQAITKAAATASQVKPGGNVTYAQKHNKAVNVGAVTSASIISQNTVGFFLWKIIPYICMSIVLYHQLCFLAGVPTRGVRQFYIYITIFSGCFYLCKYYIFLWSVYLVRSELKKQLEERKKFINYFITNLLS